MCACTCGGRRTTLAVIPETLATLWLLLVLFLYIVCVYVCMCAHTCVYFVHSMCGEVRGQLKGIDSVHLSVDSGDWTQMVASL